MSPAELIGWLGAVMYIMAYLLLSLGKLKAEAFVYHILNALGATGLIINAFHFNDYPNVVTNVLWLAIALFAMLMVIRRRRAG